MRKITGMLAVAVLVAVIAIGAGAAFSQERGMSVLNEKLRTQYAGPEFNTPPPPEVSEGLRNPIGFTTLEAFFAAVLRVVLMIAWPLLVLVFVYVGYLFVAARGNDTKLEEAKRAFLYAVIGALLILGAQVLLTAISGTVKQLQPSSGIPTFTPTPPPPKPPIP